MRETPGAEKTATRWRDAQKYDTRQNTFFMNVELAIEKGRS